MPLHKIKDPFHKFKETLSKYLPSSRLKPTPAPMATSSIFGPGKRSGPEMAKEPRSQNSTGGSRGNKVFPKELSPDLALFNNVFEQLHMECRACHSPLALDVDAHLQTWLAGTQVIPPISQISVLHCPKCDHSTCVGCGDAPKLNEHHFFTPLGVVNHCCYEGRLFGIWLLLARFDKAELPATKVSTTASPKRPVKKPKPKKGYVPAQNGVGYSSGHDPYGSYYELDMDGAYGDMLIDEDGEFEDFSGTMPMPGFFGQYVAPTYVARDHKVKSREEKTKSEDKLLINTLKLLTTFFPGPGSPSGPTEEIRIYRLSFLFDKIAELLRNDSIIDIAQRKDLYTEVLSFVQAVANSPDLVGLLLEERPDKRNSPGIHSIQKLTDRPGFAHENVQTTPGTFAPSVFTGSLDTYRQAKSFLKISSIPQAEPPGAPAVYNKPACGAQEKRDDEDSIQICQRIIDIYEFLQKHKERPSVTTDHIDTWTKFAEENRVTFDDDVLKSHRFIGDIRNLKSSNTMGRLVTIGKEVATMTTSLPAGIFVKVAESRSDAMKVLIVGPEGSPYAHGLFIFDLFLDANYPISPPKMAFVLEGNDNETYSFNPNLHRGGGVCLSLLNTWEGNPSEMWQPNKSTVLSVLISIQAMILGAPVPWINEPGFSNQESTPQAKDHKLLMQTKTVKYAMIGWLENKFNNPDSKEYVWKGISQMYWKNNGKAAFETVKAWSVDNPDLEKFGRKAVAPKKRKGKSKDIQTDSVPTQDLVEKLAKCLGLPCDNSSHKRKASSSGISNGTKKQKSESSEEDSVELRWYYKGAKTTKEVRAACKEFGIGSAPTIDACIAKLETHVNTKGKASEEVVEKWGEMREVFRVVDTD
ncbi:hypothetical protein N431DRAFT_472666 [Stipitochalara longipes BDJ]|nr:hypothetical protein N431DRAFT_472666 [Stipitochalara longipes BDJ]